MNSPQVIAQLKAKYPNKRIIATPSVEPTEILCEIDPSSEHPEYDVAIAIIDKSAPHYHRISTETYTVLEGELEIMIDGTLHHLTKGESIVIPPGSIHGSAGTETWIECRSEPGWTAEDHLIVSKHGQ